MRDARALRNRGGRESRNMVCSSPALRRKEWIVASTILAERLDGSHPISARRRRLRRIALASGLVLAVTAISVVWTFRRPWFHGNLGIVDAGLVIRSSQPTSQLPGVDP